MAVAALTPRVRTIVICDEAEPSLIEDGVFNLEGVRQHLGAPSFPVHSPLNVFLLLSSARKGSYPGKVLVVNEKDNRSVRYIKFVAVFGRDNQLLPMYVDIGNCVFGEAGQYNFEVYFSASGSEALKGEHPFTLFAQED